MKFWTLAEIRARIEAECDLEDEDFVRNTEFTSYVNDAIDEAEAEIHTLYEDYFLKYASIPVQANDELLSMVTHMPDIYADKIRRLIFTNQGQSTYTVTRLSDWHKFEQKAVSDTQQTTDLYQYFLINQTPGNPQILIVPKIREAGTLTAWYLRNANRLVLETDVCDIPEFINFIFAHVKERVFGKEGHPGYQEARQRLELERKRMNEVLANRVPDADNEIEMDLSAYGDMN